MFTLKEGRSKIGGELKANTLLDFENPEHRKNFRFKVQVTDMVSISYRRLRLLDFGNDESKDKIKFQKTFIYS